MSEQMDSMEPMVITLTDEEGNEQDFELADVIEDGESTYLVLALTEDEEKETADDDEEEQEIVIMEVVLDENNEECYEPVTDDALLDRLFEIFNKHMEEGLDELMNLDGAEDGEA